MVWQRSVLAHSRKLFVAHNCGAKISSPGLTTHGMHSQSTIYLRSKTLCAIFTKQIKQFV